MQVKHLVCSNRHAERLQQPFHVSIKKQKTKKQASADLGLKGCYSSGLLFNQVEVWGTVHKSVEMWKPLWVLLCACCLQRFRRDRTRTVWPCRPPAASPVPSRAHACHTPRQVSLWHSSRWSWKWWGHLWTWWPFPRSYTHTHHMENTAPHKN